MISVDFQLILLEMGVWWPQLGLLCGAALPFFFRRKIALFRKHMMFDDFQMILYKIEPNLLLNRGTTIKTGILNPVEC